MRTSRKSTNSHRYRVASVLASEISSAGVTSLVRSLADIDSPGIQRSQKKKKGRVAPQRARHHLPRLPSIPRIPRIHLKVSASEKIGKYNATSTNVTKHPMKIMMAGSINASDA